MNLSKLIGASVICLAATLPYAAKPRQSETKATLRLCTQLYGAPVVSQRHLFWVNRFYVLGLKFNGRGKLAELDVAPNYFFTEAHPDWEESDDFAFLSRAEYDSILAQIDTIKPRGTLVNGSDTISLVTNMTVPHRERYLHAALEWGELMDFRRGENAPLLVRWIKVRYST